MSDEAKEDLDVCKWGEGWTWLVSAYQGSAIAVKANVDLKDKFYSPANLPDYFQYCHFTNVLFRPPNMFSFMPWPVEGLGMLDGAGWMGRDELPFLRKPSAAMIEEIEKVWAPAPVEPAVKLASDGDVSAAVAAAKLKKAAVKSMIEGPGLRKL